jgi:hypothetical protein
MCTVTIVAHDDGFRVVCNRDERRSRPPALPPRVQRVGARVAAFPRDPLGGGTWIGVNDAGVALALLNQTAVRPGAAAAPPLARPRSRGLIVRKLLAFGSAESIVSQLGTLNVADFEPFRVVIVDAHVVIAAAGDGARLDIVRTTLTGPVLFTSSSLGDALVDRPRRMLFERMVVRATGGLLDAQARFHQHQWRARPQISVRMERADAVTVSRTLVDVTARTRKLVYESLTPGAAWQRRRTWCSLP